MSSGSSSLGEEVEGIAEELIAGEEDGIKRGQRMERAVDSWLIAVLRLMTPNVQGNAAAASDMEDRKRASRRSR